MTYIFIAESDKNILTTKKTLAFTKQMSKVASNYYSIIKQETAHTAIEY
jgi:hypothetical protein